MQNGSEIPTKQVVDLGEKVVSDHGYGLCDENLAGPSDSEVTIDALIGGPVPEKLEA